MESFAVHDKDTAPQGSVDLLAGVEKAFGFIPNLISVFAESPATLNAYLALGEFLDKTSFTDTERQVAILAISRFNECRYCVAAHTTVADMQNVPGEVVAAIRNDEPIPDSKLEALREFSTAVVEKRGWVSDIDVENFLAAGYTKANLLEVVLVSSFKGLSNYTNHIADTPLDDAFSPNAWSPAGQQRASRP